MNKQYCKDLKDSFEDLIGFIGILDRTSQPYTEYLELEYLYARLSVILSNFTEVLDSIENKSTEYHKLEYLYERLTDIRNFVFKIQQKVGVKGTEVGE